MVRLLFPHQTFLPPQLDWTALVMKKYPLFSATSLSDTNNMHYHLKHNPFSPRCGRHFYCEAVANVSLDVTPCTVAQLLLLAY